MDALLLFTSSIFTASMASFSLGVVMIGVIIGNFLSYIMKKKYIIDLSISSYKKILASRRLDINPDNVATPIAASLGDLVTLGEFF